MFESMHFVMTKTAISWSENIAPVSYTHLDCVTVDNNGTITANKKGTATVRAASANGKYADCVVTVQVPCCLLYTSST